MSWASEWRVIGATVRGASHVRICTTRMPSSGGPTTSTGHRLISWCPDGHGGDKSFRSDIGSRIAVERTLSLLQELLLIQPAARHLSAVKRALEERLPPQIVKEWRAAVDRHLAEAPFTEAELARVEAKRGPSGRQEVLDSPRLAYGATIVAALVAADYIAYLQLGDGDILSVSEDGSVVRPFAHDPRLIANETTSLCMEHAAREVRVRFEAIVDQGPSLILLSTDGYANSFINEEAFLKVGSDIFEMLCHEGAEVIAEGLPGWLAQASVAGSGDDISVGILFQDHLANSARDGAGSSEYAADDAETPAPGARLGLTSRPRVRRKTTRRCEVDSWHGSNNAVPAGPASGVAPMILGRSTTTSRQMHRATHLTRHSCALQQSEFGSLVRLSRWAGTRLAARSLP